MTSAKKKLFGRAGELRIRMRYKVAGCEMKCEMD